jgi:metacaspase-1
MSQLKSKAVLFGLNYAHAPEGRLQGCINDVTNMAFYLQNTWKIANVECYTDDKDLVNTSGMGILAKLYQLAVQSYRVNLDLVWIHYSGHGTYAVDDESGEERDGRDEALVPSDYLTHGVLRDDVIQEVMREFNPKTRVIIVWDCCHSATLGDLKYSWEGPTRASIENITCSVPARTITLSGCLDFQTSADALINEQYAGAMTASLLAVLQANPKLAKDVFALVAALRDKLKAGGYAQVPKLCSTHNLARDRTFIPL